MSIERKILETSPSGKYTVVEMSIKQITESEPDWDKLAEEEYMISQCEKGVQHG